MAPPQMDNHIIEIFPAGKFTLHRVLGESCNGVVYAATWNTGNEPVAIKMLPFDTRGPKYGPEAPPAMALRREISYLRENPNAEHLIACIHTGEWNAMPVMVIRAMKCSLFDELNVPDRRQPIGQVLQWLQHAATGIAGLHRNGQRHLDVKPGNMLISAFSNALHVADLGEMRPFTQTTHERSGTPGWLAPEQYWPIEFSSEDDKFLYRTDQRTDLYGLGLLFYYMVAGDRPAFVKLTQTVLRENGEQGAWHDRARRSQAALSLADRAIFMRALEPFPAPFAIQAWALVQHTLAPEIDDRPDSVHDLLPRIDALRHELGRFERSLGMAR